MSETKMFPIMDGPAIPWSVIAPHDRQSKCNHDQTLQRISERGGFSCGEAVAVLEDRDWTPMPRDAARARLMEIVKERHYLVQIDALRAERDEALTWGHLRRLYAVLAAAERKP